jgi:hypothetical protein
MGLVLGQQDRFDEAFQAFVQAGLDQADAHCDLAFIYWTKGKEYYERARQECYLARRLNPACSKAQELLAQIEDAQRPRSERVAVKSASQGAERSRPVASYGAEEKYPLPAGWARVPTNQSPG